MVVVILLAASTETKTSSTINHSRGPPCQRQYCGEQDWGGSVLFLWVNFGVKNAEVINDFLDGGRQIPWFGGSRMHDESPIIQQLLRVGMQATTSKSSGIIVLWC